MQICSFALTGPAAGGLATDPLVPGWGWLRLLVEAQTQGPGAQDAGWLAGSWLAAGATTGAACTCSGWAGLTTARPRAQGPKGRQEGAVTSKSLAGVPVAYPGLAAGGQKAKG